MTTSYNCSKAYGGCNLPWKAGGIYMYFLNLESGEVTGQSVVTTWVSLKSHIIGSIMENQGSRAKGANDITYPIE